MSAAKELPRVPTTHHGAIAAKYGEITSGSALDSSQVSEAMIRGTQQAMGNTTSSQRGKRHLLGR